MKKILMIFLANLLERTLWKVSGGIPEELCKGITGEDTCRLISEGITGWVSEVFSGEVSEGFSWIFFKA